MPHNFSKEPGKKHAENEEFLQIANEALAQVLGVDNLSSVKPLFLKNRTLTVVCIKSEMAPFIRESQQVIVEKINQLLGKNEVDRVRYLL